MVDMWRENKMRRNETGKSNSAMQKWLAKKEEEKRHSEHSGYPHFNIPQKATPKISDFKDSRKKNTDTNDRLNELQREKPGSMKDRLKDSVGSGYKKGGKVGTSVKTYSNGGYVEGK